MFFLLFSLLFSQDICKAKVDVMTIRFDGVVSPTHFKKIIYVEGEFIIDDETYNTALIEYNNYIVYDGSIKNYAYINLGVDYNAQIKYKNSFQVKAPYLNGHEDVERLIKKCCKHYQMYYIWNDIIDAFKNSSPHDINRVPR